MPLADYAHWNEDAERVWWEEEGRHADEPREYDPEDDYGYSAADAFAEEIAEEDDDALFDMLADEEYCARWPKAVALIEAELRDRGAIPS